MKLIMWAGRYRHICPTALFIIGVAFLFSVCYLIWSCLDNYRCVASIDKSYIPTPYISQNSAVLDHNTALGFVLADGCFGYVYFIATCTYCAEYVMVLLQMNEHNIPRITATNRGTVHIRSRYDTDGSFQNVGGGNVSIHWLPPTSLFFSDAMIRVALIPITDKWKIEKGKTNSIAWTTVYIPSL